MRLALFLVASVLLFGCEEENAARTNACALQDPMDAEWLQELKNSLKYSCGCETSIIQGKYLNETVFYTANTDPRCNSVFAPTLYDCSGTIIKKFTVIGTDNDDVNKIVREVVLYRCTDWNPRGI